MISLSNSPLRTSRRFCLLVRMAAAGTPSTARTDEASLPPFFETRSMRCPSSSRTAWMSLSDPSLISPRSSGRRRSSIVRCSRASLPTSTSRLRILRATRSAGQPTKLSMTMRSPVDVEIALREVPRSMPTVNIPPACCSTAMSRLPASPRDALTEVRVNTVKQRVGDGLPVALPAEQLRLLVVREAGHLGENGRHPGADEHHERRGFDAPIFQNGVHASEIPEKRTLNRFREPPGFVLPGVEVDLVHEGAQVGQRVAGVAVFVRGNGVDGRIRRGPQVIRFDPSVLRR